MKYYDNPVYINPRKRNLFIDHLASEIACALAGSSKMQMKCALEGWKGLQDMNDDELLETAKYYCGDDGTVSTTLTKAFWF